MCSMFSVPRSCVLCVIAEPLACEKEKAVAAFVPPPSVQLAVCDWTRDIVCKGKAGHKKKKKWNKSIGYFYLERLVLFM